MTKWQSPIICQYIRMKNFEKIMSPIGAEVSIIPVMQGEGFPKIEEKDLPPVLPILALLQFFFFFYLSLVFFVVHAG